MKFTKIPQNTFEELQINAGIIVKDFDVATGTYDEADFLTATTGGIQYDCKAEFKDYGEDIDNCPKNTKELKRIDSWAVSLKFTALAVSKKSVKFYSGAADVASSGAIKPRMDVKLEDFEDLWFIGDISNNGFIAIKISNALSTGGLSIKTADKGKGQMTVEVTGHVSIDDQDNVPTDIYICDDPELVGKIVLNKTKITVAEEGTYTLVADVYPADASITWASTDTSVATVSGGVVTGVSAGACAVTAKITVSGESFIDTCNVTVVEAESEG